MGIMEVMIPLCLLLLWMPSCLTVRHMAVAREEGIRPGSYFYHVEDGYYYHFSDQGEDTVYFKCVRYPRCHGRAKWTRAEGFEHTNPHAQNRVCRRDMFYAAERDLKRRILRRCRNLEYVSFTAIVREESRRYSNDLKHLTVTDFLVDTIGRCSTGNLDITVFFPTGSPYK